jgi:putative peptidoglycan lipid II flippase
LSVPIVKALFEHGAFDHTMTLAVSSVIPPMSLGVMAMILVVLLLRVFFAKGDVAGASRLGGAGAVLYFSLSGLFSAALGLQGIVLAYVITWLILLSWAVWRLWKSHGQEILNTGNLTYLRHLAGALVFCIGLIWLGDKYLIKPAMDAGTQTLLFTVLLTGVIGLAGFLLLTLKWFKMEEATLLFNALPFWGKGGPCGS